MTYTEWCVDQHRLFHAMKVLLGDGEDVFVAALDVRGVRHIVSTKSAASRCGNPIADDAVIESTHPTCLRCLGEFE